MTEHASSWLWQHLQKISAEKRFSLAYGIESLGRTLPRLTAGPSTEPSTCTFCWGMGWGERNKPVDPTLQPRRVCAGLEKIMVMKETLAKWLYSSDDVTCRWGLWSPDSYALVLVVPQHRGEIQPVTAIWTGNCPPTRICLSCLEAVSAVSVLPGNRSHFKLSCLETVCAWDCRPCLETVSC